MGGVSEAIVLDFIYKYGEKAYVLLKAAYEIYQANIFSGRRLPGDFDYKSLINKLREKKLSYIPTQLLRALERDFGILETTYRSSNQRWWKFTDPAVVSRALEVYEGRVSDEVYDDPELLLLRVQVEAVDIDRMINVLTDMIAKEHLTPGDRERIKRLLFSDARVVIKLFKITQKHEDEFRDFNNKVYLLLRYLTVAVKKLKGIGIDVKEVAKRENIEVESEYLK